jgi:hypothetical protein
MFEATYPLLNFVNVIAVTDQSVLPPRQLLTRAGNWALPH